MSTNIAIDGIGRIGRTVLRITLQSKDLGVVAINASYPPETIIHLINYDTIHGKYNLKVEPTESGLRVGDYKIESVADRNPEDSLWRELDIDIVIGATGKFDHGDKTIARTKAGTKKVLLTDSLKGGYIQMIVRDVNDNQLNIETFDIFSNASCTTGCIDSVAKILNNQFGIVNSLVTAVCAIINDQRSIDNPHKDLRRTRSCNESIILTPIDAAKTLKEVLPELEGKLHGVVLYVPTKNISLVNLAVDLEKEVTAGEMNRAFENIGLEGIIEAECQLLVSIDFNINPNSAIIDVRSTMVMSGNKVKVIAWYDDEWGYSNRVIDIIE